MKIFKAALFDLDGTLFDTEPQYTQFWKKIGDEYLPDIKDFHNLIKGTTLESIFDRFFPDNSIRELITNKLDAFENNMNFVFVNGAKKFLVDLIKNGVKCAIVTSSNQKKVDALRKFFPDIDNFFVDIIVSDMFKRSKPYPDCYLFAAHKLDVRDEECIVFEDAINGVKAAKSACMYTIGLSTTNSENILSDLCDFVVKDFSQLNYKFVNHLFINN